MPNSPLSIRDPNSTPSPSKSSSKKRNSSQQKENISPTKIPKTIGLYITDLGASEAGVDAEKRNAFTKDFEAGKQFMQTFPNAFPALDDAEEKMPAFTTTGGARFLQFLDAKEKKLERDRTEARYEMKAMRNEINELRDEVQELKYGSEASEKLSRSKTQIVRGAFEVERRDDATKKGQDVNKDSIYDRNVAAHVPQVQETLDMFEKNPEDRKRYEARFEDCFGCDVEMALALRGNDSWVKVVDAASRVWWSNIKFHPKGMEETFLEDVRRYNRNLKTRCPVAEDMPSEISNHRKLRGKLGILVAESEEVVKEIKKKALKKAEEDAAENDQTGAG